MESGRRASLADEAFRVHGNGRIEYHVPVLASNRKAIDDGTEGLRAFYTRASNDAFKERKRVEYRDKILSLLHARKKHEYHSNDDDVARFRERLVMDHYDVILDRVRELIRYYESLGQPRIRDIWKGVFAKLRGVAAHGPLDARPAREILRILYKLDLEREIELWTPVVRAVAVADHEIKNQKKKKRSRFRFVGLRR